MKRIQIFTLMFVALAAFVSCQKDNDEQDAQALAGKGGNEQISTTLANSVWSSGRNGYQEETFVEFTFEYDGSEYKGRRYRHQR